MNLVCDIKDVYKDVPEKYRKNIQIYFKIRIVFYIFVYNIKVLLNMAS